VKVILEHNLTYAPAVWLIEKLLEIKVMYFCSSNDVYQWCRPVTAQSQKIFPIHAKHQTSKL